MNSRPPLRWMITGVSTGLGRSLMNAVLRRGDRVVGTSRSAAAGGWEASGGSETSHERARLIALDVTADASVTQAVAAAAQWLGGIDVLVNNAGAGVFGPVEACDDADFMRAMDVNYFGLVRVTQAALPYLRASRGTLVNVASMAGFVAGGGTSPYAAAKHAVVGVSEALAEELNPFGVKVIVPMPGGFRTNFWSEQANVIREGHADVYGAYPCGQIRARSMQHVGNEIGDPEKFSEALIDMINSETPPLYFVAGRDAMDFMGAKLETMTEELDRHRHVGEAMSFE